MNVSIQPAHMELAESTGLWTESKAFEMMLFFRFLPLKPQFKTALGTSKSGSSYSVVASLESVSIAGLPYRMLMLIIKTSYYQPI